MKKSHFFVAAGLLLALSQPLCAGADTTYDRALEAYQKKDYKLANQYIDQFIEANPDNAYGYEAKAMILANMNYYVKALAQLKQALTLSPKNHRAAESYGALLQRAVNYLVKNGKHDDAVDLAAQSEGAIPEYAATRGGQSARCFGCAIAYFERFCLKGDSSDYKAFAEYIKRTAELESVSSASEIMTGVGAYNSGDYVTAIYHLTTAKTLRPGNAFAAMLKGATHAARGENDIALRELQWAKKTYAYNPCLQATLGDTLLALGNPEDAKIEYMAARTLRPQSRELHIALGNLYTATNSIPEGVSLLQSEITEAPNYQSYYFLAQLLHQMGDYDQAMAACKGGLTVASTPSERAQLQAKMALIAFDRNPEQTDLRLSEADAKLLADQQDAVYFLYMSYVDPKEPQRELFARKALRDTNPGNLWIHAQAFRSLAHIKASVKQPVWALEMINQAWQRTPRGSALLEPMAKYFLTYKEAAVKDLEREVARESAKGTQDANAAAQLAKLQSQLGAVRQANLGDPGTRTLPVANGTATPVMIVPADSDPSMANLSNASCEPIRWFRYAE